MVKAKRTSSAHATPVTPQSQGDANVLPKPEDTSWLERIHYALFRKKSYYISLNIIIPLIFTGLSVLSFFIAYIVTSTNLELNQDIFEPLLLWSSILAALTFMTGLFVARIILKPVETFVAQAEKLPLVREQMDDESTKRNRDELARFTAVFNQLSHFLSKVEARQAFPGIVGESKVMRGILSQVLKVAPTEATILITGDSGTGKEVIARTIHEHSNRNGENFVKINCAAIPEALLESELFGHEKGSFTGAHARKKGKFEVAHNGTILLDEIGDMPLPLQAKMLRVLEEKQLERVGGTTTIDVDVRFMAATNKNLSDMVAKGLFREDLYYRLNVVNIHLPPLRYRKDDIPLLAEYFLQRQGGSIRLSAEALQLIMSYDWPGNVRELQNAIERAVVICDGDRITPQNLPLDSAAVQPLSGVTSVTPSHEISSHVSDTITREMNLDEHLAEIEKGMIIEALKQTGGVQVRAAELLGIKERSLWHRTKKYEIVAAEFKASKN